MVATKILIPVMIHDSDVVGDPELKLSPIHPLIASIESGFGPGPTCRRLAVVDLDIDASTLRPPATVVAEAGQYRGVGAYDVTPPAGETMPAWSRVKRPDAVRLERLRSADAKDDPFLKVSAFGTVLRALGLVESDAVLARRVPWAFDGHQLLIVPVAGELDNAFYHREARSLFFYYFAAGGPEGRVVYSALSQDIVAHEATHAIVDGLAPDLFDAPSPDAAAIHEAIADMTAALLSLLNREQRPRRTHDELDVDIDAVAASSRFSRIAEEFGRWRGHGPALRDLRNERTLHPSADAHAAVADTHPHSLSEVLSGALFAGLVDALPRVAAQQDGYLADRDGTRFRERIGRPLAGRMARLIYRGLDWLPPGDVSLCDYVHALIAADSWHEPELPDERRHLAAECERRGIVGSADDLAPARPPLSTGPVDFAELVRSASARARFVAAHQELFGIPDGHAAAIRTSPMVRRHPRAHVWFGRNADLRVDLDRPAAEDTVDQAEALAVKAGWWEAEHHGLDGRFPAEHERMVGTTVVFGRDGTVHGVVRAGGDAGQADRRRRYLRQLADAGALVPSGDDLGPDGRPLAGLVRATAAGSEAFRIDGGLRALHIAGQAP